MSGTVCEVHWRREAVAEMGVAASLGLVVAFLFVTLLTLDIYPIKVLERWGTDLGMRIYADPVFLRQRLETPPIAFVDIDARGCDLLAEGRTAAGAADCSRPSHPPAAVLKYVLGKIAERNPKVIVLDFPPETPSRLSEIVADLPTGSKGPIVVAPFPLRPRLTPGQAAVDGDWQAKHFEVGALGNSNLRLASFVGWTDAEVGDRKKRNLPPITEMTSDLQFLRTTRLVPTAAFLAALVAADDNGAGLATADQLFYATDADAGRPHDMWQRLCRIGREFENAGSLDVASLLRSVRAYAHEHCSDAENLANPERLVFTIPSLSAYDYGAQQNAPPRNERLHLFSKGGSASGAPYFQRFTIRDLYRQSDGELALPAQMDESIVLLGTSAPEALDWHATPLGLMAGAEVIANAVRAYGAPQRYVVSSQESSWNKFLSKFKVKFLLTIAALIPMLFILPAKWWVLSKFRALRNYSNLKKQQGIVAAFVASLKRFVIIFIFTAMSIPASIVIVVLAAYYYVSPGKPEFDYLLPVLAVAFESIVDIFHMILSFFHHLWKSFVDCLVGRHIEGDPNNPSRLRRGSQ